MDNDWSMTPRQLTLETIAKIELGISVNDSLEQRPPCLDFSIELATPADWSYVVSQCQEKKRQTMNLQSSKTAQLIVLKDEKERAIRGWAGQDFDRLEDYPEIFSGYLENGYRHYLLWLALTHARCQMALEKEREQLFIRVTGTYLSQWSDSELVTPIYQRLIPESLDPGFRALCMQCDLFGRQCQQQAFCSMDVPKMLQHIQVRFGILPKSFPVRFTLDKMKMRNTPREGEKMHLEWKTESSD